MFNPIANTPLTFSVLDTDGKELLKTKSGNKASDKYVSIHKKGSVIVTDSKGFTKDIS